MLKEISEEECKIAHDVDTILQQKVFDHNKLRVLVQAVQQANDQAQFDTAFKELNAYYSTKSILAKELKADNHAIATTDLLKAYLANNPAALEKAIPPR